LYASQSDSNAQLPTIIANDCEPGTICDLPGLLATEPETLGTESHEKLDFPESDGTFTRFDPDGMWMIRFGSCSTFLKRYLFMR
jgi:hypothetical protein